MFIEVHRARYLASRLVAYDSRSHMTPHVRERLAPGVKSSVPFPTTRQVVPRRAIRNGIEGRLRGVGKDGHELERRAVEYGMHSPSGRT